MLKRSVIFLIIFSLLVISFVSGATTGTANVTVSPENQAPSWVAIANQTWAHNTTLTFLLTNYSTDRENYSLIYSASNPNNLTVSISATGNVSIIPDSGFVGNRSIVFYAYDYVNFVSSALTYLFVNGSTVDVPETSTTTTTTTTTIVSGGGGGGTKTVYVNVSGEDGGEPDPYLAPVLAPSVGFLCKNNFYYVLDYMQNNVATIEGLTFCNLVLFSSQLESSSLFIKDFSNGEVEFILYQESGQVKFLEMGKGDETEIDLNGDGLTEFRLIVDQVSEDSVDIKILKIESAILNRFAPVVKKLNNRLWFWGVGIIFVCLVVLFYGMYRLKRSY